MQLNSLISQYQDPNWSDEEESISCDVDSHLLGSDGYISLTQMPQARETIPQPSWVAFEKVQRSGSFGHAPKYHDLRQKKNKIPSKPRFKRNEKGYVSLFPIIDFMIWYFPTYILRTRSTKCKHYTLLFVCLLFVLFTIFAQCVTVSNAYFDSSSSTFHVARGVFYVILYLNPYIGSFLRFRFFCYKFDFSLWHTPRDRPNAPSIPSPTSVESLVLSLYSAISLHKRIVTVFCSFILSISPQSPLSNILRADPKVKGRLRSTIRMTAMMLLVVVIAKWTIACWLWWESVFATFNLEGTLYGLTITILALQVVAFMISILVPDLLMAVVARLYLTECHLYCKSFALQFQGMGMSEMINDDLCSRYMAMYREIEKLCSLIRFWMLNVLLQMVMASWHTLSMYLHPHSAVDRVWSTYNSIETVVSLLVTLFVLLPGIRMTEQMESMQQTIHRKLNSILKSRIPFYDDRILENLMNAIHTQKQQDQMDQQNVLGGIAAMARSQTNLLGVDNVHDVGAIKRSRSEGSEAAASSISGNDRFGDQQAMEMWDAMIQHYKEERALEILNRLKYLCQRHSCCYRVFGIDINKSAVGHFVFALLVTNMLSYLWDTFDGE